MSGCSFSNSGINWERTSPSRPIAQILRVVLLPAEADEQEMVAARIAQRANVRKIWLGICGSKLDLFIILNPTPGVSMRLSCLKAFLLVVPLTMACRETTAPS